MQKIKLEDGRTATLKYRGATEDERIESAVDYNNQLIVISTLANTGHLSDPIHQTLVKGLDLFREIIPDPDAEPAPATKITDLTEEDPGAGAPEVTRRRRGT